MGALKIRRDDEVVVISGKDRGKTGKVLRVDPKKSRVYVEGLNIVKRHQKPQRKQELLAEVRNFEGVNERLEHRRAHGRLPQPPRSSGGQMLRTCEPTP